ncbi:acyl-CoA carboxylase subunit epsilon [Streptomyces sp. NPDC087866]|uniref:acyl-CoA carboxylase subunit epsilon n=1 Tax=unclassified Streptomyces TaxID=2593676 RepID=UPI002253E49E|nr:acyl-CoA carboxylase subunit epsilon [Streptomyces sp. NBC_01789]MCX4451394.1 acyl-CoA carboxylase subunit epsilon [Streptomyces sp. NBC_01789]
MGDSGLAEPALRIERGRATDEELAALTVVLLALRADAGEQPESDPAGGFKRWSRQPAYRAPRSWQ